MNDSQEIKSICNELSSLFTVKKIIIFGVKRSETTGKIIDVDICVVANLTEPKDKCIRKAYLSIDSDIPFDLFLYTVDEWEALTKDKASFASRIKRNGVNYYE